MSVCMVPCNGLVSYPGCILFKHIHSPDVGMTYITNKMAQDHTRALMRNLSLIVTW